MFKVGDKVWRGKGLTRYEVVGVDFYSGAVQSLKIRNIDYGSSEYWDYPNRFQLIEEEQVDKLDLDGPLQVRDSQIPSCKWYDCTLVSKNANGYVVVVFNNGKTDIVRHYRDTINSNLRNKKVGATRKVYFVLKRDADGDGVLLIYNEKPSGKYTLGVKSITVTVEEGDDYD